MYRNKYIKTWRYFEKREFFQDDGSVGKFIKYYKIKLPLSLLTLYQLNFLGNTIVQI